MTNDLIYIIAFNHLCRNNPRKAKEILFNYSSALQALEHLEHYESQHSTLFTPIRIKEALDRAEAELDFIEHHHVNILSIYDQHYPQRLKECADAPIILYGLGNYNLADGHFVSIVGTRRATEYGKDLTRRFVLDLAKAIPNITIISGLAYGIDITAHRAALEAGVSTLIIPAHGLDRIYPSVHRSVALEVLNNGGILTEYESRTEPERYNFLARNRIIAGLAEAVLVAESKEKGGSLVTAYMANEYNRDVFAFPGRPTDENAKGCNKLIRDQQAHLIQNAEDFIRIMSWQMQISNKHNDMQQTSLCFDHEQNLTDIERQLLTLLQKTPDGMQINDIVSDSGLSYSEVSSTLMMMEMNGFCRAIAGGIYRIVL